jgi:hypothetical protein
VLSCSADAGGAEWVIAGLRGFDYTVGSVVPPAFDAYARIFHPASRRAGEDQVEVRWAEVAGANQRVMHPAAEWGSLTGSWRCGGQPGVWDDAPRTGRLPCAVSKRLVGVLADYTERPDRCCFAVWDGWGTPTLFFGFADGTPEEAKRRVRRVAEAEIASWSELLETAPAFTASQRPMRLLAGLLAALAEFYEPHRDPPSLWWPEDRAWCVGTDIDLMTTYVGGSDACINALLDEGQLEALAVPEEQPINWEADTVNPLPAQP